MSAVCICTHSRVNDHGVDLWDLQAGSVEKDTQTKISVGPINKQSVWSSQTDNNETETKKIILLVVGSSCPQRFDILRKQKVKY